MLEVADSSIAHFAQEAERRRIARELHDSVVQSLTALVADLEYFRARGFSGRDESSQRMEEKLETWQELARDSLTSVRQTLGNLRSTSFDQSFEQAIRKLLEDFHDAGYTLTYECTDWPLSLPPEYTMHLYSIVREALINISKHAQASHITLFLFSHEGHLHISISDNGIGIQHAQVASETARSHAVTRTQQQARSGNKQGLLGMRERAMLLHGSITIESSCNRGTRIDVDIPLPQALQGNEF